MRKNRGFIKYLIGVLIVVCLSVYLITAGMENTVLADSKAATSGFDAEELPEAWKEMPTTGDVKILVIRVGFADYSLDQAAPVETLNEMFNGPENTTDAKYPYESQNAYYKRSSYGQLYISTLNGNEGDIYSYTAKNSRSEYMVEESLIKEVLDALDEEIDFSQYDSDSDGFIDGIYFNFAGENTGWATTWWSHKATIKSSNYEFDGKTVAGYVFLETPRDYEYSTTGAAVLIHETGHMLGLPDYYSSKQSGDFEGKDNSIGTVDMMGNHYGDHNAFSKMLLGWIPRENILFITKDDGDKQVNLSPLTTESIQNGEYVCAVISPNAVDSIYSEYFVVQYDNPTGNQSKVFCDYNGSQLLNGYRVYRVNATLNADGSDFLNSDFTTIGDPLIQTVKVPDFDSLRTVFSMDTDKLTPDTTPSSAFLAGDIRGFTGISLLNFVIGNEPSFNVSFTDEPKWDGSYELEVDKYTDLSSVSNDAYMGFESNVPLKINKESGIRPYLEKDGKKYYLDWNTNGDYINSFNIKYNNYDTTMQLMADTEYTLVFPEKAFEIKDGVFTKEKRIDIKTGVTGTFANILFAEDGSSYCETDIISGNDGIPMMFVTVVGENAGISMLRFEDIDKPTEIKLDLSKCQSLLEDMKIYGMVSVKAVASYDNCEIIDVELDNGKAYVVKVDSKGNVISDSYVIPIGARLFPMKNGVKAITYFGGANNTVYTVDFVNDIITREVPAGMQDVIIQFSDQFYGIPSYDDDGNFTCVLKLYDWNDDKANVISMPEKYVNYIPLVTTRTDKNVYIAHLYEYRDEYTWEWCKLMVVDIYDNQMNYIESKTIVDNISDNFGDVTKCTMSETATGFALKLALKNKRVLYYLYDNQFNFVSNVALGTENASDCFWKNGYVIKILAEKESGIEYNRVIYSLKLKEEPPKPTEPETTVKPTETQPETTVKPTETTTEPTIATTQETTVSFADNTEDSPKTGDITDYIWFIFLLGFGFLGLCLASKKHI